MPTIFYRPKEREADSDAAREKFFAPESVRKIYIHGSNMDLYICINILIYICASISMCVCGCLCVCIYKYIYIYTYVYVYI